MINVPVDDVYESAKRTETLSRIIKERALRNTNGFPTRSPSRDRSRSIIFEFDGRHERELVIARYRRPVRGARYYYRRRFVRPDAAFIVFTVHERTMHVYRVSSLTYFAFRDFKRFSILFPLSVSLATVPPKIQPDCNKYRCQTPRAPYVLLYKRKTAVETLIKS